MSRTRAEIRRRAKEARKLGFAPRQEPKKPKGEKIYAHMRGNGALRTLTEAEARREFPMRPEEQTGKVPGG